MLRCIAKNSVENRWKLLLFCPLSMAKIVPKSITVGLPFLLGIDKSQGTEAVASSNVPDLDSPRSSPKCPQVTVGGSDKFESRTGCMHGDCRRSTEALRAFLRETYCDCGGLCLKSLDGLSLQELAHNCRNHPNAKFRRSETHTYVKAEKGCEVATTLYCVVLCGKCRWSWKDN